MMYAAGASNQAPVTVPYYNLALLVGNGATNELLEAEHHHFLLSDDGALYFVLLCARWCVFA